MNIVQSRLSKLTLRTLETGSLVILIVLLALPFSRAFADDNRYGRSGPAIYGTVAVDGWRLGGAYRRGGYEIWRWYRGDWRRMPGRGVQLGGNPRNPWIINSEGERYQWNGRDWRFTGYGNARGFNKRNNPPPVFRNDRGRNNWNNNRRNNRRGVIQQQQNRIERRRYRIQDRWADRRF